MLHHSSRVFRDGRRYARRPLHQHPASPHSALLAVLGRLEARLLNPLVTDINAVVASIEELCRHGVEVPLSYARESVQLMAVRREHKAAHRLLSFMALNLHRPAAAQACAKPRHRLPARGTRRLDPFSQLSAAAVSSATFYSANGGRGGLYFWTQLYEKYGHIESRDDLLNILYTFEIGGKIPKSFVLQPVVGTIVDNRWDQTPSFQISLLRLMQRYFDPDTAFRRHFVDDLNMLKAIVANANKVLTTDGARVVQYELMNTWLLASRAARRQTEPNGELRAEACLLEALKLLDTCLTPAPQHGLRTLPQSSPQSSEASSPLASAQDRVNRNMLALAKELESELIQSASCLRINKQKQGNNSLVGKNPNLLLTKNLFIQSQRGRAATGAVLTELSRLGRNSELLNALHRLFSSSDFDFEAPFVSNGIMDNSKVVQPRDIISSPFPAGMSTGSYYYPDDSLGQLHQLRENVARKSVFRPSAPDRVKDWSQHNRNASGVDWRGTLLASVLRSSGLSQQPQHHLTRQERLDRVGDLAIKLIAVAASHGVTLKDDFRAAWIEALPRKERGGGLTCSMVPDASTINAAAGYSHSIMKDDSTGGKDGGISEARQSGRFVYSIDRQEIVNVSKLAFDAEQAILKNAALRNPVEPVVQSEVESPEDVHDAMSHISKYIDETIFNEFVVSSFSKSLCAGSAVLSDPVGEVARGALIQYLVDNYGDLYFPEVVDMLQKIVNESVTKRFPVGMWVSLLDSGGNYCRARRNKDAAVPLERCMEACSVTQRHPELYRDLLKMSNKLNNGPESVQILRSMRRSGFSATLDMYRQTVLALFRFKFVPKHHEQYAQLFLRPQETTTWLLREMKRDGIKIPAEFYADLMLLFVKNARVWASLNEAGSDEGGVSEGATLYRPEYGGSDSVFTPSSINNRNQLEEVIGDAITFLMNTVNHPSHERICRAAKRETQVKESATTELKKSTLLFQNNMFSIAERSSRRADGGGAKKNMDWKIMTGDTFQYRVEVPLQGIAAQRELLLRRLLIIVCEADKYDLAREMMSNSACTFGIVPTSLCYEVLLQALLLKADDSTPDLIAAEDLISEMMNNGLQVTGKMIDLFGTAHMKRADASEALDTILEMSMQHRVMPSPQFLRDLIEFSLRNGDVMEAKRAVRTITDMKWDQAAVKPYVAKLNDLFSKNLREKSTKKTEGKSLTGSLVEAMRMLFAVNESTPDHLDINHNLSVPEIDRTSPYYYEAGWEKRNKLLSRHAIDDLFKRYSRKACREEHL